MELFKTVPACFMAIYLFLFFYLALGVIVFNTRNYTSSKRFICLKGILIESSIHCRSLPLSLIGSKIVFVKENWIEGEGDRVSVHFAVTFLDW